MEQPENQRGNLKQMKMKTCFSKPLGCSKGSPMRNVHSNTDLPKKQEVSNTQPKPTPVGAKKGIANKASGLQKKGKN